MSSRTTGAHVQLSRAATPPALVTLNATMPDSRPPALEKVAQAARRSGLSVTQVYREIKAGRLGPLVKLGARSSAVPSASVDSWILARIAEAKQNSTGEKTGGAA